MINKIKTKLIHKLGGRTLNEQEKYAAVIRRAAEYNAYAAIKHYADFLYGKNAEEWCESMYESINREYATAKEAATNPDMEKDMEVLMNVLTITGKDNNIKYDKDTCDGSKELSKRY